MNFGRERVRFGERMKNLRRLDELKGQLRKFKRAHNDEGNNEQMDNLCLTAIKKIEAEMSELTTRI